MRKVIFCFAAILLLLCACTDASDTPSDPPAIPAPIGAPLFGERGCAPGPNENPLPYLAEDLYRLN